MLRSSVNARSIFVASSFSSFAFIEMLMLVEHYIYVCVCVYVHVCVLFRIFDVDYRNRKG